MRISPNVKIMKIPKTCGCERKKRMKMRRRKRRRKKRKRRLVNII